MFKWDGIIYKKDKITLEVTKEKSDIVAHYLLKMPVNLTNNINKPLYFFIIADNGNDSYYRPVSFFAEEKTDYSTSQYPVILLVKKKNIQNNECKTLYILPKYLQNHPEIIKDEEDYIRVHKECTNIVNEIKKTVE